MARTNTNTGGGGGGGTINGTATANEVAYGSGPDALTSDSNFTTDGSTYLNLLRSIGTDELGTLYVGPDALSPFGISGAPGFLGGMRNTANGDFVGMFAGDLSGSGGKPYYAIVGYTDFGGESAQSQYSWDGTDAFTEVTAHNSNHKFVLRLSTLENGPQFRVDNGEFYTFPSSQPTGAGQTLVSTNTNDLAWQTPATAVPGGSSTDVQTNISGAFHGDGQFTWDPSIRKLSAGDPLGTGNGTLLRVDDSALEVDLFAPLGKLQFGTNGTSGNGTFLMVNDFSQITTIHSFKTSVTGGQNANITVVSNDSGYAILGSDYAVEMNPVTMNVTATLPSSPAEGDIYFVKNKQNVLFNVIVDGNGNNIDGNPTSTLTGSLTGEPSQQYMFNGSEWSIY